MRVRRIAWLASPALCAALSGDVHVAAAQAPDANLKPQFVRACGRVLSIGCGAGAAPAPVTVVLDLGDSVLLVETASVTDQNALRQLHEGQRLCFGGTLSRKATQFDIARFEAAVFGQVEASVVPKPFAADASTTCEPGVRLPKVLSERRPHYTASALRAGLQGAVWVEALVDRDGKVADVRVIRSLDRRLGLDVEAVTAAKQWRFAPGTKDGKPVPTVVTIQLTFTTK